MPGKAFDTNVLIYAYSTDPRATVATDLMRRGGTIAIQNINEFANVTRRKFGLSWDEIGKAIDELLELFSPPVASDLAVHFLARDIADRYRLGFYDAMIVAAALRAGCDTLYSEDMQHGLVVDDRLRIVNPFA